MKKFIISILIMLITVSPIWAGGVTFGGGNTLIGGGVSAGGDSCTGGLLFSWHMENVDVTLGTPVGCSAGDTTATLVSGAAISATQAHDGTNSLSIPTSSDYASFDISSNNIVNVSAGTVVLRIYPTQLAANAHIWHGLVDANNAIRLQIAGASDEVVFHYIGNGTVLSVTTTNADIIINEWRTITFKWNTADVNPNLFIQVCDINNANCTSAITTNTQPTAMVGDLVTMNIGNNTGSAFYYFIDNIKIYNSWL